MIFDSYLEDMLITRDILEKHHRWEDAERLKIIDNDIQIEVMR